MSTIRYCYDNDRIDYVLIEETIMNNQCIVNAVTTQNKNCQSIDRDVPYFPSLDTSRDRKTSCQRLRY